MNASSVQVDRSEAVVTITLTAPTLDHATKEALRDAVADASSDDTVRAVVLAGSAKAFCVGQDLGEHSAGLADGAQVAFATVREHYSPVVHGLMTMPKPVIAAVTGTCVGAGMGFALACDYRVFAAGTKLGTAFTGIGLTFDSGLSFTLPRAVGVARAHELILFGRTFTAEQGIAWGIAGETAEAGDVVPRAQDLAARLASGPTVAYAESKRLLLEGGGLLLDTALEAEAVAQTRCGATRDHTDAVAAFLRRESPTFAGR